MWSELYEAFYKKMILPTRYIKFDGYQVVLQNHKTWM